MKTQGMAYSVVAASSGPTKGSGVVASAAPEQGYSLAVYCRSQYCHYFLVFSVGPSLPKSYSSSRYHGTQACFAWD